MRKHAPKNILGYNSSKLIGSFTVLHARVLFYSNTNQPRYDQSEPKFSEKAFATFQ